MTPGIPWRGVRRTAGFTFVEILIGIIILVIGLVPLMLAYGMATKETRVSISQIQAINHSSNLLEALRAYGSSDFKHLTAFPSAMEQRKGGDNVWVPYEPAGYDTLVAATAAAGGTPLPGLASTENGEDATGKSSEENFAEFKTKFMSGDTPVVPKLEDRFRRSFQLLRQRGYVTLIVRVLWFEEDLVVSTKPAERVIELRTVVADPYLANTNLATTGNTSATADSPAASGTTAGPARPALPPMPRRGGTN